MYTTTLQVTIWTDKSPAKTGEMEISEMQKDKLKCVRQAESTWESVKGFSNQQDWRELSVKQGELLRDEAHTQWSLVLDRSSPSHRKGQEEQDAGQVVFRLSLPHRKMSSG